MNSIHLIVAGEPCELSAHVVKDLTTPLHLPADSRGIAIAVNDAVVARSRWHEHELHEGDRIEIVRATQGG